MGSSGSTPHVDEQGELYKLQKLKITEFSSENEEHVEYLKNIWNILVNHESCKYSFEHQGFGESPVNDSREFQLKHTFWKYFGFQSPNPTSDLRCGLLPLIQLHDFCQRRPEAVFWIMDSLRIFEFKKGGRRINISNHNYPFAPVGIAITQELCKHFHIISESGKAKDFVNECSHYWPLCQNFQDLYEFAFQLFHLEWMKNKRSYMDFPFAMKEFRDILQSKLRSWSAGTSLCFDDSNMPEWEQIRVNGSPHWDTDI